jgi:protease-4
MGLRAEVLFLGPALETLGVSVDLEPVGRFKSAIETFTRSTMSEEAREALASLVDDLFAQLCARVAEGRNLTAQQVEKLVDRGPFLAQDAKAAGLVDRLAYEDEILTELAGGDTPKQLGKLASPRRYERLRRRRYRGFRDGGPARVAWIPIVGAIRSSEPGGGLGTETGATSATIVHALRRARRAKDIEAVLVRVDSPGGSALASDVIWREVARTREVKPVIVSMGDHAASGGYYVAAPATAVVAAGTTITGSIGVFGGKFSIGELYRKIGVNKDGHGRGAHAAMFSEARPFTRAERKKLKAHLEDAYRVFLERVAEGRHATVEDVAKHAEGRVWTGRQALDRGLVDSIGGLRTTLDVVRGKANLDAGREIELVSMHQTHGIVPRLIEHLAETSAGGARSGRAGSLSDVWLTIAGSVRSGEALALLPLDLKIR